MKDDLLPEFQTFLRTQMLVPEKNVGFYALWASRFLNFLNAHPDLKGDIALAGHLDALETDNHAL